MGNSVIKKVNAKIKFLYRKRLFFGFREKKMLCSSLIQSSFDYACNCWFRGLHKKLRLQLQTAQNKVVRYILDYTSRTHLDYCDFKKLQWLKVPDRVDYLTLNLMYCVHTKTAPSYLCNAKPVSHNYSTRRSDLAYVLPKIKTQGSKTFSYNSVKLWNDLPYSIKNAESKEMFKNDCKMFLMDRMKTLEENKYVIFYNVM